jgi:hypothetical protein
MGLTLASTAVLAIACGKSKPTDTSAMSADLKRDLQLASASQNLRINPDEIAPKSKQELALKPKAAPSGPKVVRTNHPKVKASPTPKPQEVAEVKTDIPQVQVMASAPAPSETPAPDLPPLARPAPVPAQSYPTTASIPTTNSGSGGILGGIFGAVIRGGIVGGDDDHCDPRTMPRRGRPIGGDVYGRPGGMGGMGGMGMPHGIARPRY